jgi:ABC-type sugar transport system substrate-binding protein
VKNNLKWEPGTVKVVAGQAVPSELEFVKSGYVQSLVRKSCFQMGCKTVEVLLEIIIKKKTPNNPNIYIPLTSVNKSKVNE